MTKYKNKELFERKFSFLVITGSIVDLVMLRNLSGRLSKRLIYQSAVRVFGTKRLQIDEPLNEVLDKYQIASCDDLVLLFREHGHLFAETNSFNTLMSNNMHTKFLNNVSIKGEILSDFLFCKDSFDSVPSLTNYLSSVFSKHTSIEASYIKDLYEREWIFENYETIKQAKLSEAEKLEIYCNLMKSQELDKFLAVRYPGVKRYSCEGAESFLSFSSHFFDIASKENVNNVMIGIAHRGRLNLLTLLLNYPTVGLFKKTSGMSEIPKGLKGTGDVLSHLYVTSDVSTKSGSIRVSLLPNSSHLEAVNPVVLGNVRAKFQTLNSGPYSENGSYSNVVPLLFHGDAAFSGQGVVAECFSMANVPNFTVGGTIHVIVNNQLGFTTAANYGRSSTYPSDIAKMIDVPVVHVNGDFPEEAARMARFAIMYRQKFNKDIVVNLNCFRRWGHNELDDPSITQPLMYRTISDRLSVPDLYENSLKNENIDLTQSKSEISSFNSHLKKSFDEAASYEPQSGPFLRRWQGIEQASKAITVWNTGVNPETLRYIAVASVKTPTDFNVHKRIYKAHISERINAVESNRPIDWSTAEAMAIGSLLIQGKPVRICGQDVGRGTFSHRHVMLVDQENEAVHIPLNHILPNQTAFLEVANSILSEEATLGFEYGMSLEDPHRLLIWEAQFGDFFNGAQIIIDAFLTSGEAKWLLQSGLVVLLPHGIDGAGPEHSSCRIERFLQLGNSSETTADGDDVNINFVNPTTPAQYFHVLRRQIVRNFRKPLIVASPKVILRLPEAVSPLEDFADGTSFQPVIDDKFCQSQKDVENVHTVVFVSGKIYYNLIKKRDEFKRKDMVFIRLEALIPFPAVELQNIFFKYHQANQFIWFQEEHRNSGCWNFVEPRFKNLLNCQLRYIGREVSAVPAVGISTRHKEEDAEIIKNLFN